MPDYTLCKESRCPKAMNCCRFLGVPDEYQTILLAPEFDENGCQSYWPLEEGAPFQLWSEQDDKDSNDKTP